ncbi:hypothetical protein QBC34DRAFT_472685 [Podospora aff. communis PSN243]|uniref:Uncharacterized protein n=1 Tax=Podospora aff. communis PSN243 TaxID=3040156 RepID=A0AAV9GB97_9PEZI|nr:hypothetical protein QBC34DRAFT_472685 [Podospora aff. communis PSN243]
MPITLPSISTQTYLSAFLTLTHLLKKALASSPTANTTLPSARLAPDMIPLSKQITKASNVATAAIYQLLPPSYIGPAAPKWQDDESTLEELIARCDATIAMLRGVRDEHLEGREGEKVEMVLGNGKVLRGDGRSVTLGMGMPNVMFHVVIAYAILRARGVELGKGDYLGGFVGGTEGLEVVVPEGGRWGSLAGWGWSVEWGRNLPPVGKGQCDVPGRGVGNFLYG